MLSKVCFILTILRVIKHSLLYSSFYSIENEECIVHHRYLSILYFYSLKAIHFHICFFSCFQVQSCLVPIMCTVPFSWAQPHTGGKFGFECRPYPMHKQEPELFSSNFSDSFNGSINNAIQFEWVLEFISLHRNRNEDLSAPFNQIAHQSKESTAGIKHLSVHDNLKTNQTKKLIMLLNPDCFVYFTGNPTYNFLLCYW